MPAGKILIEIHSPYLGIDDQGNLVLNTDGKLAGSVVPTIVGPGIPSKVAITNAAGASANIANVSFQVEDVNLAAVAGVFEFDLLLSDASTGIGLTATTPSGGVAAVSTDGTIIGVLTTSKSVRIQTNVAGLFVLAITDTAKTGFYPVAMFGAHGSAIVGSQLTPASYHA